MADRQSSDSSSKPFHSRPANQGISLANLSEPLSFGPALIPTLQPVGTPAKPPGASELASSSPSSGTASGGLLALDPDEEVDSFLGQHTTPQNTLPTSTFQSYKTPQQKPSASNAYNAFMTPQQSGPAPTHFQSFSAPAGRATPPSSAAGSSVSSAPQQSAQTGPRHFTMTGPGQDMDSFLTPQKPSPDLFGSGALAMSQTPLRPPMSQPPASHVQSHVQSHVPPRQPLTQHIQNPVATQSPMVSSYVPASSQPNVQPPGPPMSYSQQPQASHPVSQSRRMYPKANPQLDFFQPQPQPQAPPMGGPPSVPLYKPPPNMAPFSGPPLFNPQATQQSSYPSTGPPPLYPQAPMQPPPMGPQETPQYYEPNIQPPNIAPPGGVPIFKVDPVRPHWFYMKEDRIWMPFSYLDSDALEHEFTKPTTKENRIVPTDGGRYDVNLDQRLRQAVYWEEGVSVVRRCTWFYKGEGGLKIVPYKEEMAATLEAEYVSAVRENQWPRKITISATDYILLHNTNVMVHFKHCGSPAEWSGEDASMRPRVVRRGIGDIAEEIEDGEPAQIDHLVFVIHGIGPIADLRFRNIIECIDDLRIVTLSMLNEHHAELARGRSIGRIEYLPIQWHAKLHNDSTGVDKKLHSISLKSITGLREFTNSTLLDILFYTSPTYCQTIVDTVGAEMKDMLALFRKRNPHFKGQISLCGHSLGSSIVFDILYHQQDTQAPVPPKPTPAQQPEKSPLSEEAVAAAAESSGDEEEDGSPPLTDVLGQLGLQDYTALFESEKIDMDTLSLCSETDVKEMGLPMGPRKKLMGYLKQHAALQEKGKQEKESRRKARSEAKASSAGHETPLTQSSSSSLHSLGTVDSVEVLYHHGLAGTGQPFVKYPKLSFKPFAMFAIGSPIGMFMTVRGVDQVGPDYQLPTCPRFFNIFHPFDPVAYRIEPLIDSTIIADPVMIKHHKGRKRMHLELRDNLSRFGYNLKATLIESAKNTWESIQEFARAHALSDDVASAQQQIERSSSPTSVTSDSEVSEDDGGITIGQLNSGKRIDYVLQEKPIESLNEYLFALSSHVCYWLSEDTALFLLRSIYKDGGTGT